ncbi:MAG: SUMF1/EgtB/PvdO family nonheme iron enzyme [bacterium]
MKKATTIKAMLMASLIATATLLAGCGGGGNSPASGRGTMRLKIAMPRMANQSNITYAIAASATVSVNSYNAASVSNLVAGTNADFFIDCIFTDPEYPTCTQSGGDFFVTLVPAGDNYIVHTKLDMTLHASYDETKGRVANVEQIATTTVYFGALVDNVTDGVTSEISVNEASSVSALATIRYAMTRTPPVALNDATVTKEVKAAIKNYVITSIAEGMLDPYEFECVYQPYRKANQYEAPPCLDPFNTSNWTSGFISNLDSVLVGAGVSETAGVCGNETVETGETCDDGNTSGGDGCSSTCATETIATNAWITIPAGDFVMGCANSDSNCQAYESPKHTVTLSQYKIQKYEVTNAQYAACVAASACTAPSNTTSMTHTSYYGNAIYDNYPAIYVDKSQASAYCSWKSGRLPTEAEWEKSARGPSPSESIYPWGDTAPTCALAEFYDSCTGDTSEVGSHPTGASYYGVMDLAGNVNEWTNDLYDETYYTTGGPPWTDPQGPVSGSIQVLRGGSWNSSAISSRVSRRGNNSPTYASYSLGFRCAQ